MFRYRCFVSLAFVGWLSAAVAGLAVMWTYEARPGLAAEAPARWPGESTLPFDRAKQTMLVWIHPRCPCTHATVSELDRLLTHLPNNVSCRVVISQPRGCDESFLQTSLTSTIGRLSRAELIVDRDQIEAKRFGVSTSGQVLLYDRDARLTFAGGITASRGHEGDNQGTATLRKLFREQKHSPACCQGNAVYGCDLFGAVDDPDPST